MQFTGRVWKFGDNINTDEIIPARYLNTSDPVELAKHCMEDADPDFSSKLSPGDIIVAGQNFGCGSSREHAPIAIKAAGIARVIAGSFARIFYRNSFNMGLPILECPEAASRIAEGDTVTVELDSGVITLAGNAGTLTAQPIPPFMRNLISAGGLMNYVREKVET